MSLVRSLRFLVFSLVFPRALGLLGGTATRQPIEKREEAVRLDEYRMYLMHLNARWHHYKPPGDTDFNCDESSSENYQMYRES